MRVLCIDAKKRPGERIEGGELKELQTYTVTKKSLGINNYGEVRHCYKLKEFPQYMNFEQNKFFILSNKQNKKYETARGRMDKC